MGTGAPVICIYILDDGSQGLRPLGGASRWWLHHSLTRLGADIKKTGGTLHILQGAAGELVPAIAKAVNAQTVHWTRRYDGGGIAVDRTLKEHLTSQGIDVKSFNGQLLFEPWEIKTGTGTPYGVFTPYWRAALARPAPAQPLPRVTKLKPAPWPAKAPKTGTLDSLGLLPSAPNWAGGLNGRWQPGEAGARIRLKDFLDGPLAGYANDRDRPDKHATSFLSPHLTFGEISPRQIWHAARHAADASPALASDTGKFLAEIGWREFSHALLFHNPGLARENYNRRFDTFPWAKPDPKVLRAWQQGQTGYPIVDAGMRELWQTGYMHNRVRMVAASFLIKHLLVDWRFGEQWFWDTLCDADPANNAASWQWVAGSGADASPYFRIFNPVLQGEKFDAKGDYVRTYVPEIAALPDKFIHKPWDAPAQVLANAGINPGGTYPQPLVEHAGARVRALAAYKKSRE